MDDTAKEDVRERERISHLFNGKTVLCLLIILAVVAVVSSVCFLSAFLEISLLKSKISSLQKMPLVVPNSSVPQCPSEECSIENINEIYSSLEMRLQLLNNTLISYLHQQVRGLENQLQLLNDTFTASLKEVSSEVELSLLQNSSKSSCAAVFLSNPSSPSGFYWIRSSNCCPIRVYCDMTLSCGNITGRWMRVAELDMTDNNTQCPSSLTENIYSNIRTCVFNSEQVSCLSVTLPTDNVRFSRICGKIRAYQFGSTDAFDHE